MVAIGFFSEIVQFFEIPQFCQFVPRLNALEFPTWVSVANSEEFIGVLFANKLHRMRITVLACA